MNACVNDILCCMRELHDMHVTSKLSIRPVPSSRRRRRGLWKIFRPLRQWSACCRKRVDASTPGALRRRRHRSRRQTRCKRFGRGGTTIGAPTIGSGTAPEAFKNSGAATAPAAFAISPPTTASYAPGGLTTDSVALTGAPEHLKSRSSQELSTELEEGALEEMPVEAQAPPNILTSLLCHLRLGRRRSCRRFLPIVQRCNLRCTAHLNDGTRDTIPASSRTQNYNLWELPHDMVHGMTR